MVNNCSLMMRKEEHRKVQVAQVSIKVAKRVQVGLIKLR